MSGSRAQVYVDRGGRAVPDIVTAGSGSRSVNMKGGWVPGPWLSVEAMNSFDQQKDEHVLSCTDTMSPQPGELMRLPHSESWRRGGGEEDQDQLGKHAGPAARRRMPHSHAHT